METMDLIKAKIVKLLATATSDNEHEAALAMSLAQSLIEKHKLSMAELSEAESAHIQEEGVIRDEDPLFAGGRIATWKSNLSWHLAKLNNCRLVKYMGMGHQMGGQRGTKLVIFGRPSDIANVRFLLAFASVQLTRLAPTGRGKEYSNSWYLGAVQGIQQKMNEAKRQVQAGASSYALVKLENRDKAVDTFIASNVGHLRSGASQKSNINSEAYNKGVAAGRNLDFNGRNRVGSHGNALGMR